MDVDQGVLPLWIEVSQISEGEPVFPGPGLPPGGPALRCYLIPTSPGPAFCSGAGSPGEGPTFCGEDGEAEEQDAEQPGDD